MLNFFVTPNGDGSFALSTAGYVVTAIVVFALLIFVSTMADRQQQHKSTPKDYLLRLWPSPWPS